MVGMEAQPGSEGSSCDGGKLPANAEDIRDMGSIPGSGSSTRVGNATHSSILDWRFPWTEGPGGLQYTELQRVGHN